MPTQQVSEPVGTALARDGSRAPDDDGGAFPLMHEEPAGDVDAMLGSSDGGARAPEVAQEGGSRALPPTDPSVLGMDIGYGPDGDSVRTLARLSCMTAKSCVPHCCAGPM